MISQSIIDRLYREQHGICQFCCRPIPPFECHHAIYTRDKRFSKWLDSPENLILLCKNCHSNNHGRLTNFETRKKVYKYKIEKGYLMAEWEVSIPFVIHDNFVV